MILFNTDWFICFGIAMGIVLLVSALTAIIWTRRLKTDIKLNAEAMRSPTNTGITTSTFAIPLLISLISYLVLSLDVPITRLTSITVAVFLLILSTAAGLWNIFSMATATDQEGKILINKNNSIFLIVMLVFQFFSLFVVLFLLAIFDFSTTKPDVKKAEDLSVNFTYLKKPRAGIELTTEQLLELWGKPSKETKKDSVETLWYETPRATITITIHTNQIKEIKETAK